MTDHLTPVRRSLNMSKIHGEDTLLEKNFRSNLHVSGFRFRKNVKGLPGKPDVVLSKYNAAIFVHGCFWHGHRKCKRSSLPRTNSVFWKNKIQSNVKRDKLNQQNLRELGYRIAIVWGCALNNKHKQQQTTLKVVGWIKSDSHYRELPAP